MSENRQKYSSSPLYGLKHSRPSGGGFQVPPEHQPRPARQRTFVGLQVIMSLLLPALFVVALILRYTELHWAFLGLSALALLIMWLGHAFVPQARTTMTLIYTALMIVSLAAALWFTHPIAGQGEQQPQGGGIDYGALFGNNVTASDVGAFAGGADITQPSSNVSAAPTPDPRSEAQSRLETFMNSWMSQDVNGMLACCTPSWINSQENPQREIFIIRGVNTPLSFNITYVAGSDSDDSRTITMEALMDRANGTQKNYRYEVLMLRVNGVWYVDPASLSSATEIKEEATTAPVYTLMPTNSPDPGQVLYYNPDGGSYYHADQNCSRIDNKYLPLKGSFLYSQLDETAYAKLQPCSNCNAPNRN